MLITVKQGEVRRLPFDFESKIDCEREAIEGGAVSISVLAGADPYASLLLPAVDYDVFTHGRFRLKVGAPLPGGFVPGVTYEITATVKTSLGQVLIHNHFLRCVSPALPYVAPPPPWPPERPSSAAYFLLIAG